MWRENPGRRPAFPEIIAARRDLDNFYSIEPSGRILLRERFRVTFRQLSSETMNAKRDPAEYSKDYRKFISPNRIYNTTLTEGCYFFVSFAMIVSPRACEPKLVADLLAHAFLTLIGEAIELYLNLYASIFL
jgi:hypothetical protein